MVSGIVQQQVPEGYQRTEVGVIPDDWEVRELGDLAPFIGSGKTNTNSKGEYPLYGSTGQIGTCDSPEYQGDAILVARVGANAGRLNFVTGKYGVSDNTIIVRMHNGSNVDYFKYQLIKKNLNSLVFGSGQPLITGSQLKALFVPVPDEKEQTAIANALADVDALITSLEKLIAKKRAIKTAAMQQLLTGKTRLPPFDQAHTGYKQTELGEIPEDWDMRALGEICTFENGDRSSNYPSPGSFVGSGIPFVNAGHVSRGKISLKDMNYISMEAFDRLGGGKVKVGDILFCLRGSLGKYGIVEEGFGFGAIASSMVIIRPNTKKISRNFLKCYFDSRKCQIMIDLWAGGAAQPNLGAQEMAKFSVPLPMDSKEQSDIASLLKDMDRELDALEQRLNKTQQLKQGMMQELLTGRTRLLKPEQRVT
jgi:type I restriction enzyme S subunit